MEWVLWSFMQLREVEEMDEIRNDMRAIDQAGLTSIAMWQPKDLARERRRVEHRVKEFSAPLSGRASAMGTDELRAWALAQVQRIAEGQVLVDTPAVVQ